MDKLGGRPAFSLAESPSLPIEVLVGSASRVTPAARQYIILFVIFVKIRLAREPKIQYNSSIMKLDTETIEYLANLARLELTTEEKERYAGQLSVIFDYIDMLAEVDTDNVPETCQVTGLLDVIRDDNPEVCTEEVREKLIASFPEKQGRLLKVKAVFNRTEE